jgi:hypothetical protein
MRNSANGTFVGRPILEIASYARRGPGRRDHFSPAEIELIQRTVNRTPEVMVKVLTRGANSVKAVRAHIAYLDRGGELDIETDEDERLVEKDAGSRLIRDWDLDVEEHRRRGELKARKDRDPPRLIHKILFSMPPGTPPEKVLQAVKNFAREEFGLQHRYAMVLHTDEPHPHVHLVVKAVSEKGARLNIRKATLRRWRNDFAAHLRALDVAANATERAVRGSARESLSDEIYRTWRRGESRKLQKDFGPNLARPDAEKSARALQATRESVRQGWFAVREMLRAQGQYELAASVNAFLARVSRPRRTENLRDNDTGQAPPHPG